LIGAINVDGTISGYFDGILEELRVSSVPRYTSNFNLPAKPFKSDAKTIALYHFDQNTGDPQLIDSSSNNHNGNIMGPVEFVPSTIPIIRQCYQSCGNNNICSEGLTCGTKWSMCGVAPGLPENKCYNPSCSCKSTCVCN